ncbi:MAG: hypothetical protein KIT84_08470 [Labilithrix sp.]|nr:hypothetical protein [Labilithrix sp.]MCW5811032.1 hypothetical protein [Labilithrix sp.]
MVKEYTDEGRWNGRLTGKPLPESDPAIDELPKELRDRLATLWHVRSAMERRVGDSFSVVVGALARRNAAPALQTLAKRAVDDEYRHEELSRLVASRYAGREMPRAARLSLVQPEYKGESQELKDTLTIIGQCVFNETTAGAYLEASLHTAKTKLARAAISELLSDEIDHGRIGWAHLAELTPAQKKQVEPWLLPLAYLNLREWRTQTPYDPGHTAILSEHGEPPTKVLHDALVDALKTLIVPGFKQLGMNTAPLEAWLAAGADTDHPPREFEHATA